MSGTDKSHATLLDELASPAAAVAAALRNVAETFAGVPDGRDTAYTLQMLAYMLDSG